MWYRVDIATLTKLHVKRYKKLHGTFHTTLKKKWKTYLMTQNKTLANHVYEDAKKRGYLNVRLKTYKRKPKWLR